MATWLLLVIGMLGSGVGGWAWGQATQSNAHAGFTSRATAVGGEVGASLHRDLDFTSAIQTLVGLRPDMSSEQMSKLFSTIATSSDYPGALGSAYIALVPGSQLAAWDRTHAQAGPPAEAGLPAVIPVGPRARYCMMGVLTFDGAMGATTTIAPPLLAALERLDWCQVETSPALLDDTAQLEAAPVVGGVVGQLITTAGQGARMLPANPTQDAVFAGALDFFAPVYAASASPPGGAQPAVPAPAQIGWVDQILDPQQILDPPGGGAGALDLTLSQVDANGVPRVLARVTHLHGTPTFTQTVRVEAAGNWMITIAGNPTATGLPAWVQALGVTAAGVAVSVLLFGLLRLLVGSRATALALVDKRTAELQHVAMHDTLTGLPNRALVLDRAEQMLARTRRSQIPIAALFIDLDNFKDINDSLGHRAGDRLLQAVGARLAAAVRQSDTVGRLGGDEFVVLCEGAEYEADPELMAQRILDILRPPFELPLDSRTTYTVSASVGIAKGLRTTAEDLLRDADLALYQAKASGRNRYAVFEQQMQDAVQNRLELEMDLRNAIDDNQFFLVYQPTFDIEQGVTTGVEALVRWRHPTRGVVGPDEFIPVLVESDLIFSLGAWVLEEACRQGARWQEAGFDLNVAVNVSARQLNVGSLAGDVQAVLDRSGLSPARLIIEITEGTLMNNPALTIKRLNAVKALGVRIAIDDFGTGYSSLAYLRQFPVDILKIDRSFVGPMAESAASHALIHTLVYLGKSLGLETVAEGIEEPEQLRQLKSEGCDTGQGFFYARPMEVASVDAFLAIHACRLSNSGR